MTLLKNSLGVWWTRNPSNNIQRHTRKEERPPSDLLAFLRQLREVKEFAYRKTPPRNKDLMCGELLGGPCFIRRAGRSGGGVNKNIYLVLKRTQGVPIGNNSSYPILPMPFQDILSLRNTATPINFSLSQPISLLLGQLQQFVRKTGSYNQDISRLNTDV